jgi:hypothetical protein
MYQISTCRPVAPLAGPGVVINVAGADTNQPVGLPVDIEDTLVTAFATGIVLNKVRRMRRKR